MRNIPITKFRKMLVKDIKEGGSVNLTADGEFIAMVIVPLSAYKKDQFRVLAEQMNVAIGK